MTQPATPEVKSDPPVAVADAFSAMTPRFNLFFRWFARRYFRNLHIDPETVARLRELEGRGAVVYVMRYASRLDYFLFNALFAREGLRLSGFANGLAYYYYQPLYRAIPLALKRLRARRLFRWTRERAAEHESGRHLVHGLVRSGESLFVFLRTARLSSVLFGRRHAVAAGKHELDFLDEVIDSVWDDDAPVSLVPLALFWRKGPRSARRFLNLGYGASTRPTDLAKVTSFLLDYRGLAISVGDPIDLRAFVSARRSEGRASIVRKVRRALLLYLFREEKAVEGPIVKPRYKVQEEIFADPHFRKSLAAYAEDAGVSVDVAAVRAEKILGEIAASMNSTFLAILSSVVGWIFGRMFASVEVSGLEKVAVYARRNPIVLVPSHRSYFDFLIVSWLFYGNHLVPPHICARENMAFGPFGFIFRRAGAFFMRRSLDDPLYKEVFRHYVGYLVMQGFTQEFFIEGGRSRTGKTLAPQLGMLTWDVEAFLASGRRDLFFVPIAITYERLVEEGAMVDELEGAAKKDESFLGLVRARKFLQRRFGSAFVNFGEPISLANALGDRRAAYATAEEPEVIDQKRHFIETLGNRIVERINWATVANATSVAACALLGEPRRGMFRHELTRRMQEVVDLLRIQDVRLTPALAQDEGEFREAIAFLVRSDLVKISPDPRGEILYYDDSKRRALEFYRNALVHYLATPSLMAPGLLRGATLEGLRKEVGRWLEILYREFFAPREEFLQAYVEGFVDYFARFGLVEPTETGLRASQKGRPYFHFLAAQSRGVIEAYYAACGAVLGVLEYPVDGKALEKEVREQFDRAELLGEIQHPEASNPVTFANAIATLVRLGILERASATGGRKGGREIVYTRGPAYDELPGLRERLAGVLDAG